MQRSFLKKLIKKYNSGTATDAERLIVDTWYESFDEDQLFIPGTRTKEETAVTRENIFNRIAPHSAKKAWHSHTWLQLAASVLLVFGAYFIYQQREPSKNIQQEAPILSKTYSTGSKEIKKILLQDSTVIWLNANSSLTLKKNFGRGSREVQLSGEANFEVKRDTLRPFVVDARELQVRVLGTSFNVRSYEQMSQVKVSVTSGKVRVSEKEEQLALLIKNQGLSYNKADGTFSVINIEPTSYTSWTEGKIALQKASYEELQQAMLNLYGIKVQTKDSKVKSFRYDITLRSTQRIADVIENLKIILSKEIKQEDSNEITIY